MIFGTTTRIDAGADWVKTMRRVADSWLEFR